MASLASQIALTIRLCLRGLGLWVGHHAHLELTWVLGIQTPNSLPP